MRTTTKEILVSVGIVFLLFWLGMPTLVEGEVKTYLKAGVQSVGIKGHRRGQYYLYRYGKDFGKVSLFGQLSRDELGKTYGIGCGLNLSRNVYVFHSQGQGIDNVDQLNREWVWVHPHELVVQHSYSSWGVGFNKLLSESWGLFIEYSRDRLKFGDDRGGSWRQRADKINLGVICEF